MEHDGIELRNELIHLRHILPYVILQYMYDFYITDILVTLPAAVAGCEYSFFKLKLIQTLIQSNVSYTRIDSPP